MHRHLLPALAIALLSIKKLMQLGYKPENLASFSEFEDLLAADDV